MKKKSLLLSWNFSCWFSVKEKLFQPSYSLVVKTSYFCINHHSRLSIRGLSSLCLDTFKTQEHLNSKNSPNLAKDLNSTLKHRVIHVQFKVLSLSYCTYKLKGSPNHQEIVHSYSRCHKPSMQTVGKSLMLDTERGSNFPLNFLTFCASKVRTLMLSEYIVFCDLIKQC